MEYGLDRLKNEIMKGVPLDEISKKTLSGARHNGIWSWGLPMQVCWRTKYLTIRNFTMATL